MTDDIFDYFSGNSARKVEPIEDDNDQPESPVETDPSDEAVQDDMGVGLGESEAIGAEDASDGDSSLASDEVEETVSHWDRLLGKLGISPSAKTTAPPKSIELPALSADEKAARAAKRKEMEQARAQQDQPFGGIAAPPGSKPRPEPTESPDVDKPAAEPVAPASR